MLKTNVLTNHFLVAMPALLDFNFTKSVVYIYEHTPAGAMGVIANKPSQINLGVVLDHLNIKTNLSISKIPVLMGGPVGQERGFILFENNAKSSTNSNDISVSASKQMLDEIAKGSGPEYFIVTLGYSGWGAGQLEKEVSRNDWLIVPYSHHILFDTPLEKRWETAAASIGIDLKRISGQVGHA